MVALQRFGTGESPIASAKLNLIVDALTGAGNTPVNHGGVNDAINYALSARNQDPAGKVAILYAPNGSTVLLQVTATGVLASPDGVAAAAPVLTTGSSIPASQITAAAWTAFIPTLTQGAAPMAATVNKATYNKIGRQVTAFIQLTAGAAGTAGSPIIIGGIPAAIAPLTANGAAAVGVAYLGSTPARVGAVVWASATQMEIQVDNSSGVAGVAPAITLANGTPLSLTATWETAA